MAPAPSGPCWAAMAADVEKEKAQAARAAAALVQDGMAVGLGTGTTVAYLLPALAERNLSLRCVATSPATERAAVEAGLHVEPFTLERLDIAIDGADQVDPAGWLVKGGGRAHTREKLVAAAAQRFVVIVDSTKPVTHLHPPVPLELIPFALHATLARVGPVTLRGGPPSPDGGIIADFTDPVEDPGGLAERLSGDPGVVDHGLFPPEMVSEVLVGRGSRVERIRGTKH